MGIENLGIIENPGILYAARRFHPHISPNPLGGNKDAGRRRQPAPEKNARPRRR
jgi:hypothetical protein